MKHLECEFEREALEAALQERWPERVSAELRAHIHECSVCSDIVAVAAAIDQECENGRSEIVVPEAGLMWWRAQLRVRREAVENAGGPITVAQLVAVICVFVVLGMGLTASFGWLQAIITAHIPLVLALVGMILLVPAAVYFVVLRD